MLNIKHLLRDHAYQNIPLTFEEAYDLGLYTLRGCQGDELAQTQSIAVLCSLHNKATYAWQYSPQQKKSGHNLPKSAAEQIAGICAAVFESDISVSEFGFLHPNVPYVMDNCGMGGDLVVTANISTLAAFIAVAAGIPMCKHGSPANADNGKYGSSDFLSLVCGIDVFASKRQVERCVEEIGFGYSEALDTRYKQIHLQTHKMAQLPHMNDIVGPITNPVDPQKLTRRVLGVNHLIAPKVVAEAYRILNKRGILNLRHGFFARGFIDPKRSIGMDEVSVCPGGTQIVELKNNEVMEYNLFAGDFGIDVVPPESASPMGNKGEYSLNILKGKIQGSRLNLVLANAAILFYLAEKSTDMRQCYKLAEEVFQSGKPYETMVAVREMLPKSLS